ncbi:hypothetical protein DYY67_0647 [Candidatus Nitrosotalea sp. TS]|nr:hypothetical protein [Candidatus Nitrosotalea sp. TS]
MTLLIIMSRTKPIASTKEHWNKNDLLKFSYKINKLLSKSKQIIFFAKHCLGIQFAVTCFVYAPLNYVSSIVFHKRLQSHTFLPSCALQFPIALVA